VNTQQQGIVNDTAVSQELAVSLQALASGSTDMVLGNVIGSNILNILLILGISAMFHDLHVKADTAKKELPMMLLMTLLMCVVIYDNLFEMGQTNTLGRADAIVLILFFSVFLYYLFSMALGNKDAGKDKTKYLPMGKAWLYTIGGIIAIIAGSEIAVYSATSIAQVFQVSTKLIALTIVALGTSLPELVTSVTATRKGEYDLAIGNVIGSNLFNIGMVLGLPVALFGTVHADTFEWYDIAVFLTSAALLFIFAANDRRISKKEGIVFLTLFVVYYTYVVVTGIATPV